LRRAGQAIKRCLRRASDVAARPGGARFVVLSHSSDEDGVRDFAARIATAVRELGLHHPRSKSSRFVTVSYEVCVADAGDEQQTAGEVLRDLLGRVAE
ncbi:MAG: diguanylate cyclase, partial [Woeseiaceae bacterium]